MLVLSRKEGESLVIGENIKVTIVDIRTATVRIGIDAPKDVPVHREEVAQAIKAQNEKEAKEKGETEG